MIKQNIIKCSIIALALISFGVALPAERNAVVIPRPIGYPVGRLFVFDRQIRQELPTEYHSRTILELLTRETKELEQCRKQPEDYISKQEMEKIKKKAAKQGHERRSVEHKKAIKINREASWVYKLNIERLYDGK